MQTNSPNIAIYDVWYNTWDAWINIAWCWTADRMTVRGSIRDLSRYLKISISMLVGKSTYSYRNKYNNKSAAVGSSEQCTTVSLRSINEHEWHILYLLSTCQAWNPMMWLMASRWRQISIISLQLPLWTFPIVEFIVQVIDIFLLLITMNSRATWISSKRK